MRPPPFCNVMTTDTLRSEPDPVDIYLCSHSEPPTLRVPDSVSLRQQHMEQATQQLRLMRKSNHDGLRFVKHMSEPQGSSELVAYTVLCVCLAGLAAIAGGLIQ